MWAACCLLLGPLGTGCWSHLAGYIGKSAYAGRVVLPQDMACDTFLKICNKCRRKFVMLQLQEREPFIAELLNNLFETIHDLQPHQVRG